MSASGQATMMDRLADVIPKAYREGAVRMARLLYGRLPMVALEHRIDALERHMDRRIKEVEDKLDEVLRQVRSRAA
jgi:hypothetical protein